MNHNYGYIFTSETNISENLLNKLTNLKENHTKINALNSNNETKKI